MKKKKYDSYEVEIIVTLGILVLFLLSINYVSGYSFERARKWQAVQFENNLNLAADYVSRMLEKDDVRLRESGMPDVDELQTILTLTGMQNITLYDSTGNIIIQTSTSLQMHDSSEVTRAGRLIDGLDCGIAGYLEVSSFNAFGKELGKLSRWDLLFRIGGLIASLIVGAYFLRAVLVPYRRIKDEAMNFNFDTDVGGSQGGIEYVIDTFKNVIFELEDKKSHLESLFRSSEKRADLLARHNEYILGSISSGVIICDSQGIVTRFNPSAQEILRHLEKDCRGKHYRDVFKVEEKLVGILDDSLRRHKTHSRLEFEIKRPDGKKLWLGCSSSLINDEKGEGMGAVLLLIDLTEIRRLQDVSSYNEKMVTLGETAAGLAHEIRNAFAAIIGFANLLKRNIPKEQVVKIALTIRDESIATEALLSRFLSFARPLETHPQKVELRELIESTVGHFSHGLMEKIKISRQYHGNLPPFIIADPVLLKQALSNLLINSCDAMPEGGDIRIIVQMNDETRYEFIQEVLISVIDNGIGIDSEHLGKIFDPFFTLKSNGTGLGLALVKKMVVMHGGRIEVYSKPAKGTRFTLHLPVRTSLDEVSGNDPRPAELTAKV